MQTSLSSILSKITEESNNSANQVPSMLSAAQNKNGYDLTSIAKYVSTHGGTVLGKGSWGIVLMHPNWKYVLKIFKGDVPYLKYVRLCIKHPRPSFPVFYDLPRKIKPASGLKLPSNKLLYAVKMEKLKEITTSEFRKIEHHLLYALRAIRLGRDFKNQVAETDAQNPKLKQLKEDFLFLREKIDGFDEFGKLDLHEFNIMKRENGEYVLSDPLMARFSGEEPEASF